MTKVRFAVPARPVTRQHPELANVSLLAQKWGECAPLGTTFALSGLAWASSLAPATVRRLPAERAPHHGNFSLIEPSPWISPKNAPGGGGRVVLTTILPLVGSTVHNLPLPWSSAEACSPGGVRALGIVTGQARASEPAADDAGSESAGPLSPQTTLANTSIRRGLSTYVSTPTEPERFPRPAKPGDPVELGA